MPDRLYFAMVASSDGSVAVFEGSAGCLEVLDATTERTKSVPVQSQAWRTHIHRGSDNHFVAVHMISPSAIQIAVHCFVTLASAEGWLDIIDGRVHFGGSPEVWQFAPKLYVMSWGSYSVLNCDLIAVRPDREAVTPVPILWFDDSYDKGYEALACAYSVPKSDLVFMEMGRADPVLLKTDGAFVQKLTLAGRYGGSAPEFVLNANQALVTNYDTLVKVSTEDWSVQHHLKVQPEVKTLIHGQPQAMRHFAGCPRLSLDQRQCVVPRPAAGDLLIIDVERFEVAAKVQTGDDPIEACFLEGSKLLVRFWKSGLHKVVPLH